MSDLTLALTLIDRANSADPTLEDGQPAALLYGQRMSAELARLFPQASDVLQIAARDEEHVADIVAKTAAKMSEEGRARVLAEFPLPEDLARAFR